ncbi:hypothetical protein BGZ47_002992 [Haplosporangium gracile]|nr:hypothetical protein BGZ47_002992 [Haplosporangium gracile]
MESLAPGNLVDFRMGLDELDDEVTTALLEHRNRLETLEIGFSGFEFKPFGNVAKILSQCKKLKRVSKGLESLEIRGFYAGRDEFAADDGAEDGYDVHNPDGDPAAHFELRGYLPKSWRYMPKGEDDVQRDEFGRAFVHPHLRFMVVAAVKGTPMMKRVILNNE